MIKNNAYYSEFGGFSKSWFENLYALIAKAYSQSQDWDSDMHLVVSKGSNEVSWVENYDPNAHRFGLKFDKEDFDYPILDRYAEILERMRKFGLTSET